MNEENSVCPPDVVYYTLRQSTNFVGEFCSLGSFIRGTYQLHVPLFFYHGGAKHLLEGDGDFNSSLHHMVGMCA